MYFITLSKFNKMKRFSILVVVICMARLAGAQKEDSIFIRAISDQILKNGRAYSDLHDLTKNVGGRLSGSPSMVKAEQWGLRAMQGCSPDKAFMQECMVPHWVRGGTDFAEVSYNSAPKDASNVLAARKSLDVIALGNSAGSGNKLITAPVLLVNSFDELEKNKDAVKGKIVFYNYKFRDDFINTFQAYGDAVQYRGGGASRASKYGAVAVIVRSMSHSGDNNPHTGAMRYDTAYAKIPAVAIGLQDADWLSSKISDNRVRSVSLRTNGHFLPDTIGHNIIGELTGTEFPNEVITVGGHLDSWDPAEGAHDDGAGCVQTIEILRTLKALGYKPRHTIRFVLFANEENGGRGGDKYATEAKAKGEHHIFALESDEGGFTPRGFGFTMPDEMYNKVLAWQPLLSPYGCSEFKKGGGGSDIGPLGRTFNTPMAGLNPDSQRYFDFHHARNDVFEAVNKRELELGAVNMAALIYLVDKYGL
jgi:carboxypeptidase Q